MIKKWYFLDWTLEKQDLFSWFPCCMNEHNLRWTCRPAGTSILNGGDSSTTQSSSIGAVRWTLPEEDVQTHSSAPSRATNNLTKHSHQVRQNIRDFGFPFVDSQEPTFKSDLLCFFLQQHVRQNSLRDLRSLQECVQFIHHWKEQVDQVCKVGQEGKC